MSNQDKALIVAAVVTVFEALSAYDQLRQEGVSVRVIDLFSVHPIDREELISSVTRCFPCLHKRALMLTSLP